MSAEVSADSGVAWHSQLLEKLRPEFEALYLGIYDLLLDRCATMADFVNQVLEAYPGGQGLSLGKIKYAADLLPGLAYTPEIEFLHKLRLCTSHGDKDYSDAEVKRFSRYSDTDLRRLAMTGADQIGRSLRLSTLGSLVGALL